MKQKKVINKRSRNATIISYYGITFKSKLELYCYKKLKENNISFEYEGKAFEIVPAFQYKNDSWELFRKKGERYFGPQRQGIRAITYTPDFVGNGWIIETKGNPNETFPLKWKLFKKYIVDNKLALDLYMPRNQKQIDEIINIIITKEMNAKALQNFRKKKENERSR